MGVGRPMKYALLGVVVGTMFYALRCYRQDDVRELAHANSGAVSESCLLCHADMKGFSVGHSPEKIGCAACHLGDVSASTKVDAHRGMLLIPGNLSDAAKTCSTSGCHAGVDVRVKNSLMNTMSGVVGVDRYVFGETDSLDGFHDIKKLGKSAADTHLRNLCASCHLGQKKCETGPITELSRGGGCNACHLNYGKEARAEHVNYHESGKKRLPGLHPTLSLRVDNGHCFGCHSRSGRISTNYEGWHETQMKAEDVKGLGNYRLLEDGRVFTFVKEDVHHARGMDCIDCHGALDVMGSGIYKHQEQAVFADCRDCHRKSKPMTVSYEKLSEESKRIVRLRGISEKNKFVVARKSNMPLVNVFSNKDGKLVFRGKNSGKEYALTSPGAGCTQGGVHSAISCSSCHTSWAPQCISCHTSYDKNKERYDLLDRTYAMGAWMEKGGHFMADFPSLGVVEEGGRRVIKTFVPGMVMTLDQSEFLGQGKGVTHHRLFAPTSAHTIAAKGQGCKGCHNNPLALGYGRGKMTFSEKGEWKFTPLFSKWKHDGLPMDAWIGFLEGTGGDTTRSNARAFNLSEQRKILRVGSCLTCHREGSEVVKSMLVDFEKVLTRRKKPCLTP